jgi:uncharacterized protein (DUF4415 family)
VDDEGKRRYEAILARSPQGCARGKSRTRADAPAHPVDEEFWRSARVVMPPPNKASVHLRLDADVLEWFREQGRGHLSRMNAVLRSFMEAHKR